MKFEEKRVGDFCVYTGAVESLCGDGYMAAVVVQRDSSNGRAPQDVFRDERMAGGHRWPTAREALHFAMQRGLDVVRNAGLPAPVPTAPRAPQARPAAPTGLAPISLQPLVAPEAVRA